MRGLGCAIAVVLSLGIASTPEAAEDLAADRVVPIAEGGAHGARARCPRPSAKNFVFRAEEGLGVFGVGKWLEAGVLSEVAGRPLPYVADHPVAADRGDISGVRSDGCRVERGLIQVGQLRAPGLVSPR